MTSSTLTQAATIINVVLMIIVIGSVLVAIGVDVAAAVARRRPGRHT